MISPSCCFEDVEDTWPTSFYRYFEISKTPERMIHHLLPRFHYLTHRWGFEVRVFLLLGELPAMANEPHLPVGWIANPPTRS